MATVAVAGREGELGIHLGAGPISGALEESQLQTTQTRAISPLEEVVEEQSTTTAVPTAMAKAIQEEASFMLTLEK